MKSKKILLKTQITKLNIIIKMQVKKSQKQKSTKSGWDSLYFKDKIRKEILKQKLRKWKKNAQKSKHRKRKIEQWWNTEVAYLKKLLILRDQVRKSLLDNKLMTQTDSISVFSNLDAMIRLSELVNLELKKIFTNWNPIKSQLSPVLNLLINCLKIYKEYSERHTKSFAFINEVANKPSFKTCVKVTNLDDLLFSPVQRFMKYHLFLSEYISKLPKYHKEIENLNKSLSYLLKATNQINEFITNQDKAKKMVDLQKNFGNILSSSRIFKKQFNTICYESTFKAYLFNNLLLIVKVNGVKEQLKYRIELCSSSFVVKQPDCSFAKNRLFLCGYEKSIHMNFNTSEESGKAFDQINSCILTMYQNQSQRQDIILQNRLKGAPISTENIFKAYTARLFNPLALSAQVISIQKLNIGKDNLLYIVIKITTAKPFAICQYLMYEIRQLQVLQTMIQKLDKNFKTPTIFLKQKNINKNDATKFQENLAISIQNSFNFVLRNQKIIEKSEFQATLAKLGINESMCNFVMANRINSICLCQQCKQTKRQNDFSYYYKQRDLVLNKKSKCVLHSFLTINNIPSYVDEKIFKSLNIDKKMIWARCKLGRIDYNMIEKMSVGPCINLKVNVRTFPDANTVQIKNLSINSTFGEIISRVCQKLIIVTTTDLAMTLICAGKQWILDDDQKLKDFIDYLDVGQPKIQPEHSYASSFWEMISGSANNVKNRENLRIEFGLRKIYVFNYPLEQEACQRNYNRYQLVLGSLVHKLKESDFHLCNQEMVSFCALAFCISHFNSKNKQVDGQKIKKYLPMSNVKQNTLNEQFITKVKKQVSQLLIINRIELYYKNMFQRFAYKTKWLSQYFKINNSKNTPFDNEKNLLIGVSYKNIIITQENRNIPFDKYPLTSFKYHIYGNILYVETDTKQKSYQLNCQNLFALDTMIKIYKLLEQSKD